MAQSISRNFWRIYGFVDGQQITLTGGNTYDVDSVTNSGDRVVTVRNTTTNTFELFGLDGTTALNVTSHSQSSPPLMKHTTIVLSNVQGTFGELMKQ